MPPTVVERTLSGGPPLALVAPGPLPTHTPPCAWQLLGLSANRGLLAVSRGGRDARAVLGRTGSLELAAADFRHAALLVATHVPLLASHLPELEQALDFAQSCAVATGGEAVGLVAVALEGLDLRPVSPV